MAVTELDASLGYEKNQKGDIPTSNKRNGHSPKTLKSQYGEFQIDIPRDREGEFEPKLMQEKGTSTSVREESELTYSKDEVRVPIHLKMTLTIKEAAEYSNIGMNKIDTMLKQPNCPFVLFVGTRKLVKRREFEEYIRREVVI